MTDANPTHASKASRSLRQSMGVKANGHDEAAAPRPSADLRAENEQLREIAAELQAQLSALEGSGGGGGDWENREREFEALLEEKSEMIRTLNMRARELETAVAASAGSGGGGASAEVDPALAEQAEE